MSNAPIYNQLIRKHTARRKLLDRVYNDLRVGVEQVAGAKQWVVDGVSPSQAKDHVQDFERSGILSRRIEYGSSTNGLPQGRNAHYTLLVPKDEALRILDVLDKAEIESANRNWKKAAKVAGETRSAARAAAKAAEGLAVRTKGEEPVEAIAGPDPVNPFGVLAPLRKNESFALVEAARQYRDRDSKVNERIEGLLAQAKEFGLTVDEALLRSSISAPVDDRLDVVVLVLPYIDQLERQITQYEKQNSSLRQQLANHEQTQREIVSLRDQNRRLLAKQVSN